MTITVASGKGGTGKTTFSVNLAYALSYQNIKVNLLDCDVEEPNDFLFINPKITDEQSVTALKPEWDENKCCDSGKCAEVCTYNAIARVNGKTLIFNELCHSCGACSYICPSNALIEKEVEIGQVKFAIINENFHFAYGILNVGEALAPTIVKNVKKKIDSNFINIIDASPGTACPVVEALNGADVSVLVTEPTPFGVHDLKLAASLTQKLGLPTGIVVNKSDGEDKIISDFAKETGIPIIGRIPFKREFAETYSYGGVLVEKHEELIDVFMDIYKNINELKGTSPSPNKIEVFTEKIDPQNINTFEIDVINKTPYKETVVISGKGGTGKTSVLSSLALISEKSVLADNDVDAADLHLVLKPEIIEKHEFSGGNVAVIDQKKCISCGKCEELCHFDAIHHNDIYLIDELSCEGCGLCSLACPVDAISEHEVINGNWFVSETKTAPMVHALLGVAEENTGKLVTKVRKTASAIASQKKYDKILADGPPGTGCPVIASLSGVDLAVIVTEPTVSGVHDLERVLKLAKHFRVESKVVINKADLNKNQADRIYNLANESGAEVIAEIPFDDNVLNALKEGKTVIEYNDQAPASKIIKEIYKIISE